MSIWSTHDSRSSKQQHDLKSCLYFVPSGARWYSIINMCSVFLLVVIKIGFLKCSSAPCQTYSLHRCCHGNMTFHHTSSYIVFVFSVYFDDRGRTRRLQSFHLFSCWHKNPFSCDELHITSMMESVRATGSVLVSQVTYIYFCSCWSSSSSF